MDGITVSKAGNIWVQADEQLIWTTSALNLVMLKIRLAYAHLYYVAPRELATWN